MYYFIDNAKEVEIKVIDALCYTALPYLIIKDIQFFNSSDNQVPIPDYKIGDDNLVNGKSFQKKIFIEKSQEIKRMKFSVNDPNSKETKTLHIDLKQNSFLNKCVFDTTLKEYLDSMDGDE